MAADSFRGALMGPQLYDKIKSTISRVDGTPYAGSVTKIPTDMSGDSTFVPKVFRVCTATGAWPVDTEKQVKYYGVTSTPNTVSVLNKLVSLPSPRSTNTSRIVNIAKDGTQWYLVSFQMSAKTAVIATATSTITFLNTAGTQTISFASASADISLTYIESTSEKTLTYVTSISEIDVIASVSATLNTTDCKISVTTTTQKIKTANNPTTTTFKVAGDSKTVTFKPAGATQTATVVSLAGTQTATILAGTFTATFVSLEI